jgi:hypothetical protein
LCSITICASICSTMGIITEVLLDKKCLVWYTSYMMKKEKDNMNKEQIEDMMITLEELGGEVRNLTYAIRELRDVNENLSKIQFLNLPKKQLKDAA